MVIKGMLKRVGGGISDTSRSGPTFIDALEVAGHPELRHVRGTRYLIDHVRSAVGKPVTLGLVGKAVVAIRYDEALYKDESLPSLVMAHEPLSVAGIVVGVPLAMWYALTGSLLLAGMYFYFRSRVRSVVAAVAAGT